MFKNLFICLVLLCFKSYAQQQTKVDFLTADIVVTPNAETKSVSGTVTYNFTVLAKTDSVFLDAQQMQFSKVVLNNKNIAFTNTGSTITINKKFKKGSTHILNISYSTIPKQTLYFVGYDDTIPGNEQIWTQGQGKYTSHWAPSFDDMEEKLRFNLSITAPKEATVIANGKLTKRTPKQNKNTWQYTMQQPMSSYLLAFAIGNYAKQELKSQSGIPIANYYYPKDSLRVEPTYRHTKQIFDFLETEIGVPYPWQNYKQIPVHDFLYAGMENTGTTIFSDAFMIDSTSFIDKNYVNVNAHELAHQWFGNLVTEKNGEHHWLHEGFATYYAYLAAKEIFGEAHYYWKLYDTATQLKELSDRGKGESLLNPKASSLTFYEKGAWALVALRELVGNTAFKKGVTSYVEKFKFRNATVTNFITQIQEASGKDLSDYKNTWLLDTHFPWEQSIKLLEQANPWIKTYTSITQTTDSTALFTDSEMRPFWTPKTPTPFKTRFLTEYITQLPDTILVKLISDKPQEPIEVRQLVTAHPLVMTPETQNALEGMLSEPSYKTQEQALLSLWQNIPAKRNSYLEQTSKVIGLPNKNVRLLWLTLALITPGYEDEKKIQFFNELNSYTATQYNPEIRQMAFIYLNEIDAIKAPALKHLIVATSHHAWQFRNFSRNLIDTLLTKPNAKEMILQILPTLNKSETLYIQRKLAE